MIDSVNFQCACVKLPYFYFWLTSDSRNSQDGQHASRAKFRGDRSNRCGDGDFSIFQNGAGRHLGFLNFRNFNGRNGHEGQTASSCQISWRSVKPLRRYDEFSFSRRPPPSGIFLNFEILTVVTTKRAKLSHCTKFRGDWSNCCGDMAILRFFQDGGHRYLDLF